MAEGHHESKEAQEKEQIRGRGKSDGDNLSRLTTELDARKLRRVQTLGKLEAVKKEVRASLRVYQVISIDTTKQEYCCEFCLELSVSLERECTRQPSSQENSTLTEAPFARACRCPPPQTRGTVA